MKAGDLKPCAICSKGVMHQGVPLFFRVTIEHMCVDVREVERSAGHEQFIGNVALSRVFHDPDIAQKIGESKSVLVCQRCSLQMHPLALLMEAR